MSNQSEKCCLCHQPADRESVSHNVGWYNCNRCGSYVIDRRSISMCFEEPGPEAEEFRAKLTALTREQTVRGLLPFVLYLEQYGVPNIPGTEPVDIDKIIDQRWPPTVPERLDRILMNLANCSPRGGDKVKVDIPLLFGRTDSEAAFHREMLSKSLGFIDDTGTNVTKITLAGWKRIAELRQAPGSKENPAFVAMWFGKDDASRTEMQQVYDNGIAPGVKGAGYKVTRVDIEPHGDYIMNKVLGDIRIAPFVVADFTGHRNGVYFEAGFARGLSIPVINTCRKDEFEKAHFDTKQLLHLRWETPEDLCEKLTAQIRGLVGPGPHASQEVD